MTLEPDPGAILPERVSTAYRLPPQPEDVLGPLDAQQSQAVWASQSPEGDLAATAIPEVK